MRALVRTGDEQGAGVAAKRSRASTAGQLAGAEQLLEATNAFEWVGGDPEVLEQDRELGRALDVIRGERRIDCGTQIVLVRQHEVVAASVATLSRHVHRLR